IRLAQRAYRSRKENAIQTLEKKVQCLRETNEKMSNTFMQLHDFAVSLGLLERVPEFARELRATTEKFLALARESSEEGEQDERAESPTPEAGKVTQQDRERSSSPEAIETQPSDEQPVLPWGGYVVMTEPEISPNTPLSDLPSAISTATRHPLDYEIITMPTLENASFPFGLNHENSLQGVFDQTSFPPAYQFSPLYTLPIPGSLASAESTFGRRLQRTALERGLQLITMANPPKERFAKVFGFSMLFESLEKVRDRLRTSLDRTIAESLNNWQAPFWALGGAGQHHIQQDHSQGRVGNQGTADRQKYAFAGGHFGLGPFDTKTGEIRNKRIDPRMRITLPGFQGDFYDAEEVELYLQSRGVSIGPGQDYVTTHVDVASFEEAEGQQSIAVFDEWPQSIDDAFDVKQPSKKLTTPSLFPGTSSVMGGTSQTMSDMPGSSNAWPVHDGASSGMFGMSTLQSQFPEFFTGRSLPPGSLGHDPSTLAFAGITTRGNQTPETRKRLITLDVNAFITGKYLFA
ncbi:hypothetical protein SLS53_001752, partial [Cytospora paraplurivora]